MLQPSGFLFAITDPNLTTLNFGQSKNLGDVLFNGSKYAKFALRLTGVVGVGLEGREAFVNIRHGAAPIPEAAKFGADLGAGALLPYWPVGTIIGGSYIGIDSTIGWERVLDYVEQRENRMEELCSHCYPNYP